jgi:hypothetical protein
VTGQEFQLYPATGSHPESAIEYHDELRAIHIEPITHHEVQIIQEHSAPDVSRLDDIAATSKLFKHGDLAATLVVNATERKREDRYFLYWYLTIPTLVVILSTIAICNTYTHLFKNLVHTRESFVFSVFLFT